MSNVRLGDFVPLVEAEARKWGIDPTLARSILIAENSANGEFDPNRPIALNTTSPKGAYGAGQVMPATKSGLIKTGFLPADFKDDTPEAQAQALVATLREQKSYAGSDPRQQAAMYNGGFAALDAVRSGNLDTLNPETRQYLQKVGKNMAPVDASPGDELPGEPAGGLPKMRLSASGSNIPAAALQHVQDAAGRYEKSAAGILAAMRGVATETGVAAGAATTAAEQVGQAKGEQAAAKLSGVEAQEKNRNDILAAMGVNALDSNSRVSQLLQEAAVAQDELRALHPQLKQLREVSFMDDPLGWVGAQFQLQQTASVYNSTAARYAELTGAAGELQQRAGAALTLQPGVSVDAERLSAAATAKQAAAEAKMQAFQIGQHARSATVSALSTELRFADIEFDNAKTFARLATEKWGLTEVVEKDKKAKLEIEQINVFRTMIAATPITADQYKSTDAKTRTEWLTESSRGNATIADSPGQAMSKLLKHETMLRFHSDMSPQGGKLLEMLHKIGQNAVDKPDPLVKRTPEERYAKAIDDQYAIWRKEVAETNNGNVSDNNPFKINASTAAQAPALKGNSIAQYVLGTPNAGAGTDDKAIWQYAVAQGMTSKRPVSEIAAELTKFYWEGTKFQDQDYRMSLLGFNRKNPTSGMLEYNVSNDMYGFLARGLAGKQNPAANIKMFSQANVEHALTLAIASQKASGVGSDISKLMASGATGPGGVNPMAAFGLGAMRNTDITKDMPAFGSKITNVADPAAPGLSAPGSEWDAYHNSKAGK